MRVPWRRRKETGTAACGGDVAHLAHGPGHKGNPPHQNEDEAHPQGRGQIGIDAFHSHFGEQGGQRREHGGKQRIILPHDTIFLCIRYSSRLGGYQNAPGLVCQYSSSVTPTAKRKKLGRTPCAFAPEKPVGAVDAGPPARMSVRSLQRCRATDVSPPFRTLPGNRLRCGAAPQTS